MTCVTVQLVWIIVFHRLQSHGSNLISCAVSCGLGVGEESFGAGRETTGVSGDPDDPGCCSEALVVLAGVVSPDVAAADGLFQSLYMLWIAGFGFFAGCGVSGATYPIDMTSFRCFA